MWGFHVRSYDDGKVEVGGLIRVPESSKDTHTDGTLCQISFHVYENENAAREARAAIIRASKH